MNEIKGKFISYFNLIYVSFKNKHENENLNFCLVVVFKFPVPLFSPQCDTVTVRF